jgi:dUTP pyrophosphatase
MTRNQLIRAGMCLNSELRGDRNSEGRLMQMDSRSGFPPVLIQRMAKDVTLPKRAFPTDSGLDLYAYSFKSWYDAASNVASEPGEYCSFIKMCPGDRLLVGIGIKATVGPGYEIQVRPRSGLALKQGITVVNTPGTVDEQYRGEICVILINTTSTTVEIRKHDRIAQMVVCPVTLSEVEEVEALPETDRGAGGFGHTGGTSS